jgi:predicted nucleotide-binding protein (sugar kinase/HSP70/actin superfamily)
MPPVNIDDEKLLKKTFVKYLRKLGVSRIDALRAFQIALDAQQDHKQTIELEGASIIADAQAENRSIVLMLGRPYHIDPAINHKIPEILTGFGMDVITEAAVPRNKPERLNNQNVMTQWEYINRYYHASSWAAKQKNVIVVLLNSFGCGPDPFIMDEVSTILGEYGKNVTVLRIDEIESPGSAKLRLRSMLESVRQQTAQPQSEFKPRKTIKLYGEEDRSRTLVVPDYSMFYTAPLMRPFIDQGYKVVCMPPSNRESVETGLKYVHNEICYPGTILIGDFVKALQSGEHDLENTAVVFPQTGGQCRATSYASMIKKAMLSAGFEDIPVVTFSTNMQTLNQQPGFDLDLMSYMRKAAICLIYTDALSDMYYSTAVRELNKGDSHNTATRYIDKLISHDGELDREQLLAWLDEAVTSFNNIPIDDRVYPKVGIVGEIYVKYNEFSNNFVADWLMDHGIEVVVPTIIEFLSGGIISVRNKVKTHLQRRNMQWLLTYYGDVVIHRNLDMFKAVMQRFDRYQVHHGIRDIAKKAKKVVSLNHQYGEGWMLPGEVGLFAENGVTNVLCLQPFGCIANHVIAKGIQNRLKSVYPDLNLLFLDADAGVSEVNFFNRMHFFINTAKQDLKQSVPVY